jgi:hypothetical protein
MRIVAQFLVAERVTGGSPVLELGQTGDSGFRRTDAGLTTMIDGRPHPSIWISPDVTDLRGRARTVLDAVAACPGFRAVLTGNSSSSAFNRFMSAGQDRQVPAPYVDGLLADLALLGGRDQYGRLPAARYDLLSVNRPFRLAIVGAIFPETNGPENQLRSARLFTSPRLRRTKGVSITCTHRRISGRQRAKPVCTAAPGRSY